MYEPLPRLTSTRLVHLYPHDNAGGTESQLLSSPDDSDLLSADLHVIDLRAEHPEYIALSYTWGSAELTRSMKCNGETVLITDNLHSALRRLRKANEPILLWCDALSINQGRDEQGLRERAQQVQMMGDIFGSAKTVVVDLGSELGASPEEYEALSAACRQLNEIPDSEISSDMRRQNLDSLPQALRDICADKRIWPAFASIVCRPYWSRVWVVQENVLARRREIMVGHTIWPEELFDKPLTILLEVVYPVYTAMITLTSEIAAAAETDFEGPITSIHESGRNCPDIQTMRQAYRLFPGKKLSLLDMLDRAWRYFALDLRDRVYALFSLCDFTRLPYQLSVDYSISLEELSVNVSKLYFASRKFGKLLRLVPAMPYASLPSWCLDLRLERMDQLAVQHSSGEDECFSASESMPEYLAGPSALFPGTIAVGGCLWDSVSEVVAKMRDSASMREDVDALAQQGTWDRKITDWTEMFLREHLSPEEIFEARWRTLISDLDVSSFVDSTRAAPQSRQSYRDYVYMMDMVAQETGEVLNIDDSAFASALQFYNTMSKRQNKKRMGGTAIHHQIGLFAEDTVVGDRICIFSGVSYPWVIRPQPDTLRRPSGEDWTWFKLVGPCYVHGIMDGEASRHPSSQFNVVLIG
jgi:hypothetical protein